MVIFTSNFQSLLQLVDLNLCDRIYPSAKLRGLKGEGCLFERTLIREGALYHCFDHKSVHKYAIYEF